jgi:hypothetical protein
MRDAAVLDDLIRATFTNVGFPKGTDVAVHDCEECDAVRKAFSGQIPFSLPSDVLEYHHDALPLMSPEAFHHFLPAYLTYSVNRPTSLVAQSAWFSLSPPELDQRYTDRFGRFSDPEKAVVLQVVEFMIEVDKDLCVDERERARRYWRAA